ncbi:MAG TPA: arylsulfatase [Steroidobacteraceae bacterium]|nr:arylsulfatase [Steroidobacteraceae bacterium]
MLIRIAAVLLAALPLTACQKKPAAEAPVERPNIVYILADDLGYADLGILGGEIPTPNLDQLARGGMLLTDFHPSMTCSPTRAMLMSGVDHHLAGMGVMGVPTRDEQKGQPGYEGHLNLRVASLADLLTDAGYNTYMAGKWHLGGTAETGPHARGFRRVFASVDGAAHLGPWDWRGPQDAQFFDGDELVTVGEDWYSTRDYTKKMIEYIEQDRAENKPFFAYMAYTAPHWPLQAPAESIAKFKGQYDAGYEALYARRFARQKELGLVPADAKPIDDARFTPRWSTLTAEQKRFESRRMEIYAAMVSDLDQYVGELIGYLEQIGELDNTFIVFSSDNGAEPGRRDLTRPIADHIGKEYDHSLENLGSATSYVMYGPNWASAGATPFNRHKFTAFDGGTHVPAFVYYPQRVKAGTRSDAIGTVMDLLPTFLALAGTQHPGTSYRNQTVLPVQGRSLLPVLYGDATEVHPADALFGWELFGQRAVRQGDWKLVWDHAAPEAQRRWQLFNLAADPFEQNDLAASNPDQYQQLLTLWDRYDEEVGVIY